MCCSPLILVGKFHSDTIIFVGHDAGKSHREKKERERDEESIQIGLVVELMVVFPVMRMMRERKK